MFFLLRIFNDIFLDFRQKIHVFVHVEIFLQQRPAIISHFSWSHRRRENCSEDNSLNNPLRIIMICQNTFAIYEKPIQFNQYSKNLKWNYKLSFCIFSVQ